ncbi:DUF1189 domain-containing protein [Bacillus marinisedimentorum]|uniref:DUF1189 domain-containing protein n=1 Tax=Bacillus marinisedimentorum TaxID=1821260 RepID=UPI000872D3DF|nr:DUF1189 domain-containing protein [Bacillus marinisedimentorum]
MNVFKQFYMSFASPKTMASFRFQGIGKTILYVFVMMLISMIPAFISMSVSINAWLDETTALLSEEVPAFKIENGELTSEADKPIIRKEQDFTFVFDSTGELSSADLNEYENALALLKNQAVYKMGADIQTLPYEGLSGMEMSKERLLTFLQDSDDLLYILLPILFLIMYIFQTGFKFIGITVLAFIGMMAAKSLARKLTFKHIWVMSAYAVTIPTIFFALVNALGIFIPFSFLLYWATAIVILYLVIKEVPLPKEKRPDAL